MAKNDSSVFETLRRFMQSAPVDVEAAIRALGIYVGDAWLDPDVSGQIERTPNGGYKISVNVGDPPTRKRFTMAHELGHYLYHRDLIGDGLDDDRAYRSTAVGKYHNTMIGPHEETEANRFAANFLMPKHLIEKLERDGMRDLPALAKALGVSLAAMRVRKGLAPYPGAEGFDPIDIDDPD